jgi:hypothetical protein
MIDVDGKEFNLLELPATYPGKFALNLLRKTRGAGYIKNHICEPSRKTVKDAMDVETVDMLKSKQLLLHVIVDRRNISLGIKLFLSN